MQYYYQVRYGGCNHSGIMSESQLHTSAKGQQINPEIMTSENIFTCNACLNAEPGYCSDTVLHPIISARKLTPLEIFQLGFVERKAREAKS
jgi:hypothetical protein